MEIESKLAGVASLGAIIGFAQLLSSDQPFTWRKALGRAGTTAGLAMSAFSLLAFIPNAPTELIVGVACGIASIGTDVLVKSVVTIMESRYGKRRQ